ncbi:MAG: hypothetical protein J6X81_02330 [Muribaculaceae bacterium]|nr:hypothetical protein [Muribaculaceae bacterium]
MRTTLFLTIALLALASCSDRFEPLPDGQEQNPEYAQGISSTQLSVLTAMTQQQAAVTSSTEDGYTVWTCTTTGNDPRVFVTTSSRNVAIPAEQTTLSFEYKSETGITGSLQIFFAKVKYSWFSYSSYSTNDDMESQSLRFEGFNLPQTEWKKVEFNVGQHRTNCNNWGVEKPGSSYYWSLWFDLGNDANRNFKIRNIQFRSLSEEEAAIQQEQEQFQAEKLAFAQRVDTYLNTNFPSSVAKVVVTQDEVIVSGNAVGNDRFALAEITPYEDVTEMETFPHTTAIHSPAFSIRLPRYVERDGFNYDRLLSKWAIISLANGRHTLASHARYADEVAAKRSPLPLLTPPNKKGILGMGTHSLDETNDFEAMGNGLNSVGTHINEFLMTRPLNTSYGNGNPTYPPIEHKYGGKTYYIAGAPVASNDHLLQRFNSAGCMVTSYVELWPTESSAKTFDEEIIPIVYHPERNGGYQLFPNVTTPEAINAYAAFLEFVAERYTRDGQRIHHWIAHNEVNAPGSWANMGKNQPEMYFTDAYMKSMHLIYNIIRQYDQNASVSPCFTHNWTQAVSGENEYAATSMIANIKRYDAAEGEIFWGICHHPYPITSNPDFWNYDPDYVDFTQSTPYITFYNLEVLADWANNSANYYHGRKRPILLLEQGVNSRTNSDADQTLQAAGVAWVWKKVNAINGIDGIAYYSWVDNDADFGLMLGLRRGEAYGYAKKKSWYVWKAAATADEDDVFAPYLSVCGLTDWSQVLH